MATLPKILAELAPTMNTEIRPLESEDDYLWLVETFVHTKYPDDEEEEQAHAAVRALLREELLKQSVLKTDMLQEYETTFDGYGDSGQVYPCDGPAYLSRFFEKMIDIYVNHDWWNNEGGGGNIHWDLNTDKIILNSHYNETRTVDVDVEAEI